MLDIAINKESLSSFLNMALQQGISQTIYDDPFFFMKALKLELARALDPEILEILQAMANNEGPGILHFIGFPEDPAIPQAETAIQRSQQKTRVTESLILASAALLNCYLYSKKTEQNGLIFHNISPVTGKEQIISSVGRDPFYYHTEIAYSPEVPKFLMLICLESDPLAKTSYFYINDILAGIPEEIKQIMRKPIFRISAVAGYDSDSIICSLLSTNPDTHEETFRFYQDVKRIEPASDNLELQTEAIHCLTFLEAHASKVFPKSGSEPSVGLQRGEALLFNNGRGSFGKHHGVMHGRVGRIENPNRWLQRGYFFEVTPSINQKIQAGYMRFLTHMLKRKNSSFKLASETLKTAISNTPEYRQCKNEHPEYTQTKLFFHAIKPRNDNENRKHSWLKRIAEEADIPSTNLNTKYNSKENLMPIFENIEALLIDNNARFRVIEHEAAGKSEDVARIRGNELSRSAKAIAIDVKMKDASVKHCIVVMPASCQLNSKVITKHFKAKSVSMTPNLFELTGCEPGTLPPFTFQDNIQLLIDSRIANLPDGEIFFNAGALTRSIALNVEDYIRITSAPIGEYAKNSELRAVSPDMQFFSNTNKPNEEIRPRESNQSLGI